MKALLISPKGSNFYAKIGLRIPPLGLAYIAAVIRTFGHEVRITDLGIERKDLSPADIKWADIIGISADTPRYPEALSIAKVSKKYEKAVVMGGYHVTFLDKEALDSGFVDFIVRGEGEETFLNLLNTLENNGNLSEVDGISYIQNGIFRRNKDRIPPSNLNNLPFPARDLLPLKKYNGRMNGWRFTSLVTSRGCPYNCYFCSSSKFGGLKWRARSAQSIADEIEHLVNTFGYQAFSFMDDNFTLNPQRVIELADELKARKMDNIHWWCFSRVDTLANNEYMIQRMTESGAYMVFLGLESNNDEILRSYNKHIGNEQQLKAIELLNKYGISIHGSYIIGNIKETKAMAEATIKWAKNLGTKSSQFSLLTPYPGTALYDDIKKENRFLHRNWRLYDGLYPVIKLDYLTPEQTRDLLIKAYRNTYLNFSSIFSFNKNEGFNYLIKNFPRKIIMTFKMVAILLIMKFKMRKIDRKAPVI